MLRFSNVLAANAAMIATSMMIMIFALLLLASSSSSSFALAAIHPNILRNLKEKAGPEHDHLKTKDGTPKIDTIVHLMMENRAFAHLLGWSAKILNISGLTGNEFNYVSSLDPSKGKVYVSPDAEDECSLDWDHSTYSTTSKIYTMKNLLEKNYTEDMMGFVEWEVLKGGKKQSNTTSFSVMRGYSPDKAASFVSLAQEYSVFDKFFASVAGCTWPNRAFAIMGSSWRNTETYFFWEGVNGQLYPQKTIFDQLEEAGLTWKIYTQDVLWENFIAKIAHAPQNVGTFEDFENDSINGNLPNYAFINPQGGVDLIRGTPAKDCHPRHLLSACGNMVADTYAIVRKGAKWNSTMFITSFDEHGGAFDPVPPPTKDIPIPTAEDAKGGIPDFYYKFDRLGIRIPFFVASPWTAKGTVVSDPPASEKPYANSAYDLTSIMATVRKVFGMNTGNLTARDGWAATFSHVLNLDEIRTDCPMEIARVNTTAAQDRARAEHEALQPVTDLQRDLAIGLHQLTDGVPNRKTPHPKHLKTEWEYTMWAMETWNAHKDHHALHKKGLLHATENIDTFVSGVLDIAALIGEKSYDIINASQCGHPGRWTVATRKMRDPHTGNPLCMTWNQTTSLVSFQPCLPSADPCKNQMINQIWSLGPDYTYSPIADTSMCMTTVEAPKHTQPALAKCNGSPLQSWLFNGNNKPGYVVPGDQEGGELMNGNGVFLLFIMDKTLEKKN